MIEGTLIGESLRVGGEFGGVRLAVKRIWRSPSGDVGAGQPELWTFIEFQAEESDASALADGLAAALEQRLGWYADFRTKDETFVVYAGRVFRYRRGDGAARAEAQAYGRSHGVPENQLDWPV